MTTESATGGGISDSCEQEAVQKQRNHQGMKYRGGAVTNIILKQTKCHIEEQLMRNQFNLNPQGKNLQRDEAF